VFGDDWGRHVSTLQHLFGRISRETTVIWFNSLGQRKPGIRDLGRAWQKARAMTMLRGRNSHPSAPQPGVAPPQFIVEPRVLPWHDNRVVSSLNRMSLKRDVAATVRRARVREFVLVTGNPVSAGLVGECGERASIYFCMDDFLLLPGTSPEMIAPLEQDLLRRVDAVVATAQLLVEKKVPSSGISYHLPQGVNYQHFAEARPAPAELQQLPRPIVGFAGGVGPAVDTGTLHALSRAIPTASIVLIGPVSLPRESLRARNIHVMGPRAYQDLPAYVQAFDVGIIPYVDNEWTRTVDSLKLLEYLAAGIPVVATPLPEMHKYADAISLAAPGDPFVRAVTANLQGTGSARGAMARAYASRHSWERRAERFLEIVDQVMRRSAGKS
jgi:glycosyltransferase involved in cell wall biosynthesis